MFTWPLERQLTGYCGVVVFTVLALALALTAHTIALWRGMEIDMLLTLLAMLAFRLLLVPLGRRLDSLVQAAERLASSDASVRLAWAPPAKAFAAEGTLVAQVSELAKRFLGSFHGAFSLDKQTMTTVGKLSVPALRCGRQVLNLDESFVDGVGSQREVATIFILWRSNFVRISTSLCKPDGSRAIGTLLDKSSPAYTALSAGEAFVGAARLFGKDYATRYEPLRSDTGEVIGALFVGIGDTRPTRRSNQIQALGQQFNTFAAETGHFLQSLSGSGEAVVDATVALTDNMATVVDASSRQSAFAQSVGAAIEQMTVSIDLVANSARETESIAGDSRRYSEAGASAVDAAAQEIGNIADYVDRLSEVIASLAERSGDIGGIVDVIRKISDKTNVLALNAAVEAARAGEEGRGFAIVAAEVRTLAAQTVDATERIAGLIADIHRQIDNTIQEMEAGKGHVDKGVRLAATANESLADIMQGADGTVARVGDITAATNEQATASKEIARNFEEIAQRAEREAESVNEISREVEKLEQLSARFHSLIHRFNY